MKKFITGFWGYNSSLILLKLVIVLTLNLESYAQDVSNEYKVVLTKINEKGSEYPRSGLRTQIIYNLVNIDSFKTKLYDIQGEVVLKKDFGLLESGIYELKFYSNNKPGIYFVTTKIGDNQSGMMLIQINAETSSSGEHNKQQDISVSIIDGKWNRSYTETFIPAIQPSSDNQLKYNYRYDIQFIFLRGNYKINSKRTCAETGETKPNTYTGTFLIAQDSLMLFQNSQLYRVLQFKIIDAELYLSDFSQVIENNGEKILVVPTGFVQEEIKLSGKYSR